MQQLNSGISAHLAWKRSLLVQVSRYHAWLQHNHLLSQDLNAQLLSYRQTLSNNNVTLAFVGEFSRGKTELINALFFSTVGKRLLPSRVGRTTMCPTEIFHDPAASPNLRLLPIETRLQEKSIQQLQATPEAWHEIAIAGDNPVELAQTLSSVAHTKEVSPEEAVALGFDPQHLDASLNNNNNVCIPAWRHAMVNFDHPLLKQGLRILDTPGLNALGSEPELTLSMLPAADAIVFLLGADTGVTASDMQMWEDHIRHIHDHRPSNLFAILNKVDTISDPLMTEEQVRMMVDDIRHATAQKLQISASDVLPMSARDALTGRLQHDQQKLQKSGIQTLEKLLSRELVSRQEFLISRHVIQSLLTMLGNSRSILQKRQKDLSSQQWKMNSSRKGNRYLISELTTRTRELHNLHHRRLLTLKSSKRLIAKQGDALSQACRPEVFQNRLLQVQAHIRGSLTTAGIGQAISKFFDLVHDDIYQLGTEAKLANRLINSIYERHRTKTSNDPLKPKPFITRPYIDELEAIRNRADHFRKRFSTVLANQSTVARRFLATLAQEVTTLHNKMAMDAGNWAENALLPMTQHALEQKQLLEEQLVQLRALTLNDCNRERLLGKLDQFIHDTEHQLAQIDVLIKEIRRPAPARREGNIVHLHAGTAIA
ncbi:dynamin family protein [Parendozoicomonas sp. Alg238-R29]|uniref:dynamin family protein n=1 Tax=Parendozoicomonas sp. Alg238-R29 TaxID=2993446 RepID=UPI00248E6E46|nr:dynamin family protein [Parendozoicomonas sp. Alg238-R29]